VTQPRPLALLCYLALARPRGLQPRDTLIELLWPDRETSHGRKALRNALHSLRGSLGEGALTSVGDQLVGLNPGAVWCDALELERGAAWGDSAALRAEAIEPLQGFFVRGAPGFDRWLSSEQARLSALLADRARVTSVARRAVESRASGPYSTDAWALHARGHYLFLRTAHGGSVADLTRSRECFERALQLDPAFAPALAGLSNYYAVAARRGVLAPFREAFRRAIELSHEALAKDPELAVPHVHFGVQALYLDGDFDRAGIEFATAVAKDPGYAEGHRFYGVWLGLASRTADARAEMEQAVLLEPDIPHFLSSLGAACIAAGDRTAGERALRRTLEVEPTHGPARARLLRLLDEDGRHAEAVAERERMPAVAGAGAYRAALDAGVNVYRALIESEMRREVEALEEHVLSAEPDSPDDLFSPPVVRLVQLYVRLGDFKRARARKVEALAHRPDLARWFASIPELTGPAPNPTGDWFRLKGAS
jgi:DNA-binding SARP family transcriptional activator